MAEPVRFQHYEVLRRDDGSLFELGRGAMGITYKAFDTNLRTNVALKVINATYLNSETARQRFLREARAAAAIRHPNVATVFHLGNEDDAYFYAMEFIDGETVESYMQREGAVGTLLALEIASQVARALAAAEKQGLVHRDIKPSNLMLVKEAGDDGYTVKVIDFGLAKAADKESGIDTATLTMGGFLGTPHFASPEQLEERELDTRSDIYSLGVTLYYMLAGRAPFSGSLAQVMSQHLHREPPLELLASQPRQVIDLLERMMAKDPADRPQTPAALRREIEDCIEDVKLSRSGTHGGEPTEAPDADTITDAPREASAVVPAPGVKLAGYLELIEDYKAGEFGRTFRARNLETGATVAVLIFDPAHLPTSEAYTRLENEVTALQSVKHPAVLRVHSIERAHHISFVTREWVEGISLLDAMRQEGALPAGEALKILTSLAGGLEAVQKADVPCPELAAHWIMLVRDPETQETLPKFNALNFSAVAPSNPDATLVAGVTPAVADGADRTAFAQALARLAYQMLGGMQTGQGAFIPIPGLSEDANLVLRRAQNGDFVSPVAFVAALEDAMDAPVSAPPRSPAPAAAFPERTAPARRPAALIVTILLGLCVFALLAAIALVMVRKSEPPPPATPSPTPTATPLPSPTPVSTPAPTPDPLGVAFARVNDLSEVGDYAGAFFTLEDLAKTNPGAASRIKDETEKIAAKLRAETPGEALPADKLVRLDDPLTAAAQMGSTSAQMLLAKSYLATDPARAFKNFYLAAVDGGNSEAMYQLGDLFLTGRGTPRDENEAFKYYEKAAGLLEPQAMFALGQAYFFGMGSHPKDLKRSFQILKLAADGYDNRLAQNLLGDIYRKGMLGDPNYAEAFRLWSRAAAQGFLTAQAKLGVMYYAGEIIDGKPAAKADETRGDPRKAFELWKDGASRGNPSCMYYYASCLMEGIPGVVEPDKDAGRQQMIIAAENGDPQAQEWCATNDVKYRPPAR